jgi:hypothetical protein
MICCLVPACLAVLLNASFLQDPIEDAFLDLTQFRQSALRTRSWGSGGGSTREPIIPLIVELVKLNKSSYALGEDLIFEVTLTNITDGDVFIPWEPDWTKIEVGYTQPPTGYLKAHILLEADSEWGMLDSINVLYGSESVAGSIRQLSPGHSVRIRAPGRLAFPLSEEPQSEILGKLPVALDLHATIAFMYAALDAHISRRMASKSTTITVHSPKQAH